MISAAARNVSTVFRATVALALLCAGPALGAATAFKTTLAQYAAGDEALAAFYRDRDYDPIWTGEDDLQRRQAFLQALAAAPAHGLPRTRYSDSALLDLLGAARSPRYMARAEAEISKMFLAYARDMHSGVLSPSSVDGSIFRTPDRRDPLELIESFAAAAPGPFLKSLVPHSAEYNRLLAEKLRLEGVIAAGGWGEPVAEGDKIEPGATGARVIALRNRLIAMGYLGRTASASYDAGIQRAVRAFQSDHGLLSDGVVGEGTIEAMNLSPRARLGQVLVAMERERWLGEDRGKSHILVNITDFHARIIDNDKVTFKTRSVVGANTHDRRTPEFSDVMEHMIINPTWNVPYSIATKEYLPMLKKNPNAVSHLRITDRSGRAVDRSKVDFTQFSTSNFPFAMKQPPSGGNALGRVKFMFPNRHNIYLHDTPQKSLFSREKRAFSHGCIRLNDPFDFAYELLRRQVSDPQGYFKDRLESGSETLVKLQTPLPVHIIYRTAFTQARGNVQYRGDVYGRDAKLLAALVEAGVVLGSAGG